MIKDHMDAFFYFGYGAGLLLGGIVGWMGAFPIAIISGILAMCYAHFSIRELNQRSKE